MCHCASIIIVHVYLPCTTQATKSLKISTSNCTRRMFGIATASRSCKNTILIKRSKVRKDTTYFCPRSFRLKTLLPCLVSQLAELPVYPSVETSHVVIDTVYTVS